MAALKVNPDNSVTLPIPLLGILVTLLLALAGWGNSLRQDVGDLKAWRVEHTKQAEANLSQLQSSIAKTNELISQEAAASTRQNAELQETLTTVRIQVAASLHAK